MLEAATPHDPRDVTRRMHEAVVEARAALAGMREAMEESERAVMRERSHLEDTQRRGRLAAEIDDTETVAVAERFSVRHRERLAVLERKLEAQRAEIALAEREVSEMYAQLKLARARAGGPETDRVASAMRDLEDVGRSVSDGEEEEQLRRGLDRAARERAAEAELERLKRKMGR